MAVLLQAPYNQFLDDDGNPLTGGFVYAYAAGTDTPKDTYTSYTGLIPASNPVELDASGRADIWIEGSYKFTVKDSSLATIRTVDNITAVDQGGDMTKAVYDPANIAQQLVGTTAVQTMTNKTLTAPVLSAGTTGLASFTATAGTNLTTATAGSTEYDGKVEYFTPQGTQRGVVPAEQVFTLNSALVGGNVTTAQDVFGVGVTLSGSTRYQFEATYNFSKSAGATSHTVGLLFGGTATLNDISYNQISGVSTTSFTAGFGSVFTSAPQVATTTVITTAIASATSFVVMRVTGVVSVNVGGTFRPQYILSAAPGGAYSTAVGSTFRIYPIGASGANVNVGAWA